MIIFKYDNLLLLYSKFFLFLLNGKIHNYIKNYIKKNMIKFYYYSNRFTKTRFSIFSFPSK